jgi:hypothetical protein
MELHDLDKQVLAAIEAGDVDAVDKLGQLMDELRPPEPKASLLQAALWYASVGLPVFPLGVGGKLPLFPSPHPKGSKERLECKGECGKLGHGCNDALTDAETIRAWWTSTPYANVGIATGHRFDVVDIDGPEGHKNRSDNWDDIFAKIDADAVGKVLTPRPGGMHIYVPATGDGNSTNVAGLHKIDYRGVGGYVVAPPSVISESFAKVRGCDAGPYRWLGTPRLDNRAEAAA